MLSKPSGDSVYPKVLYRTSITRAVLLEETVNGPIYNVAGWGSRLGLALCEVGTEAQSAHTGHGIEAHVQGLWPGALVLLALLSKEEWKL